jgi:voltage-gated potassium channel
MIFLHQAGAAVVLITLTLWLQCGGIAALVAWARHALAGEIHNAKPVHIAVLVVRFTAAVIILQGLEILLWAGFYRWICLPSWESALYFSMSSYSTIGLGEVLLPLKWRIFGPLESIIGVVMSGVSVSVLFAIIALLVDARAPLPASRNSPH